MKRGLDQRKPRVDEKKAKSSSSTTRMFNYTKLPSFSEHYVAGELLGEGEYGIVKKVTRKSTGEALAVKEIEIHQDKYDESILERIARREVDMLHRVANHPNILRMIEVCSDIEQTIYIVLELAECNLRNMIESEKLKHFSVPHMKGYMLQITRGLAFCHERKLVHRDMKTENILVTTGHVLKIADFGLARIIKDGDDASDMEYTRQLVTLHYRCPELLVGHKNYGFPVDVWSLACIFYEMLACRVMFRGGSEAEQLNLIWNTCGSPTPEDGYDPKLARVMCLYYKDPATPRILKGLLTPKMSGNSGGRFFPVSLVQLMDAMLMLCPSKRPTAREVLENPYFVSDAPKPYSPEKMPIWKSEDFKKK